MRTMHLLFVLMAAIPLCSGIYVVSFPNALIPGIPLEVRVLVQGASGNVNVKALLKYVSNNTLVVENSTYVQNGKSKSLILKIPVNLSPSEYKIVTSGSGGLVFQNQTSIHYTRNVHVFIQTDKSRYSAGQTVKYRAVLLLPNLLNFQGQAIISIKDGKSNRIEVVGPIDVQHGVVSGQIELSTQPAFGTWNITIEALGNSMWKTFKVNDYILPRFKVDVIIPPEINVTHPNFTVTVISSYTFRGDVIGNCSILLYNEKMSRRQFELHSELNGTAVFTVNTTQLINKLDVLSKIIIRATVMDHATFLTMTTEKQINLLSTKQPSVTIRNVDPYKTYFLLGYAYKTKLIVERNGQPLGKNGYLTITPKLTTAVLKTCKKSNPSYKWVDMQTTEKASFYVYFDNTGYANLSYIVRNNDSQKLTFEVTFHDTSVQSLQSSTSFDLYPWRTAGMPFLQIYAEKENTPVGETFTISITSTKSISGKVTVEVYSRGILLETNTVEMNNSYFKMHRITASDDMVPQAYILVYHLTTSGYLMKDFTTVKVNGNPFRNKVDVFYNTTQLQPGQNISMHITADPSSTVYVLVQDERNRIIGTSNDIFSDDVLEALDNSSNSFASVMRTTDSGLMSDANEQKNSLSSLLTYQGYPKVCTETYMDGTDDGGVFITSGSGLFHQGFLFSWGRPPTTRTRPGVNEIARTRFPETWIWDKYTIGSSGNLNITLPVPDSMTTWVTSVFAMNDLTGFGINDEKRKFSVQRNFFLTMDLPSSIVFGEKFLLQITAFNYELTSKRVYMKITLSDDPDNPIPASAQVPPQEGKSTYVLVEPKALGTLSIDVIAITNLFSTSADDRIVKHVTIRPKGVYRTVNEQILVDVSANVPYTKTISLPDPEDMVSGTKFTRVTITGNFMIPSIEGLGQLIRLPYGCGEQTMLNFAPAIYITKYLSTVGKLTKEIQEKAIRSLKKGLQNELSYQHYDGSFSAFGNRDSSGSSWLTAFVLKCFGQAHGSISIDETVMSRAMTWLLKYQQSTGAFSEPGRVIHYEMQAGTASGIKMTAFILISLLENRILEEKVPGLNSAITKGQQYLETYLNTASNVYTFAITCYALTSANSPSSSTCYTKLKNTALIDDDKTYWRASSLVAKRDVNNTPLKTRAPSADIETTSYALLTYMKLKKHSEAFGIVKWLVSQRNPTGGWTSTQDTIISLQALTEFSSSYDNSPGPNYGVQFHFINFQTFFQHSYASTQSTIDVLHTKTIPSNIDNLMMQVLGEGTAVMDITTSYYVSGNETSNYIAVEVSVSSESVNSITINSCIIWTGPVDSGMLIMDVEMPTGFQADTEALKAETLIKRHETRGRNLDLYFDGVSVSNNRKCVNVKMDRVDAVVKSQACHVTVYDYYEPSRQAMKMYESGILKADNICAVCPHCGFCTGAG